MSKNTNLSFLTDYITADITNGRIGINNASPTVAFDVVGATKITGVLTLTSTISNGTYAYTLPSATGTLALTSALSGTTNYLAKFTSSTGIGNSLIFDNATNVGINTATPTAKLEIYDNANSGILRLSRDAGNQRGALEFGRNNGGSFQTCGSIIVDSDAASVNSGLMYFYTSNSSGTNTERMRITSGGDVYIGKTSTSSTVVGINLYPNGQIYNTSSNSHAQLITRTNSDGKILIFYKDATEVGSISTNTYALPSDLNFKKNINNLTLGLNLIGKLRPVSYNHKIDDKGSALSTGFIAQELEQSLTQIGVNKNEYYILQNTPNEDESQSQYWLDYTKMIPVLVKAIQELSAEITILKNK